MRLVQDYYFYFYYLVYESDLSLTNMDPTPNSNMEDSDPTRLGPIGHKVEKITYLNL